MIDIIILAHNQLASTKRTIESVFKYTKTKFQFILIDNGSTDGTLEYFNSIKTRHPKTIIKHYDENQGFIIPNNWAMQQTQNDVLLLNNDIEIIRDSWLMHLNKKLHSSPEIGLTYPINRTRDIMYTGGTINNRRERLLCFDADIIEPTWAQFCCVLIKREVIDKVGLLDERFSPGYFEDVDYCVRLKEAGYKMFCLDYIVVEHYQSVTSKNLNLDKFRYKNRDKFYEKWKEKF